MNNGQTFYELVRKSSVLVVVIYFALAFSFYAIAGDQLRFKTSSTESAAPESVVGEIIKGVKIEQIFRPKTNQVDKLSIFTANFARHNTGNIQIEITDNSTNEILYEKEFPVESIPDNAYLEILKGEKLKNVLGEELKIRILSKEGELGNAISVYTGKRTEAYDSIKIDGQETNTVLSFVATGQSTLFFGKYYFWITGIIGVMLASYCFRLVNLAKVGGTCIGLGIISSFVRYRFLLEQLVARDFKTKYKRSVLGVLWSFLNPLLTMLVQYAVFSTLFKSDIENFAVYLLTGIVVFSFVSETSSMGLMSIVGNATLITKVYVPKYIYPISRVLSSAINMLLSIIPLMLVVLLTGTQITPAILLLPFGIICLVGFCIGLVFVLSASMVFFRDTQFLWNVMIMLWMYFTPIFYPESIIPQAYMWLYRLNPLYHFIRFLRIIVIQGVSPEPKAYLFCLVYSVGMLLIGAIVFKKTQDKFVLNL